MMGGGGPPEIGVEGIGFKPPTGAVIKSDGI